MVSFRQGEGKRIPVTFLKRKLSRWAFVSVQFGLYREEQARKARASMSRHLANMAVAASVNGGGASGATGGGGSTGGSRPGSALRSGSVPATPMGSGAGGGGGGGMNGWTSSPMSTVSAVVAGGGGGVSSPGVGMRARFSSATIAAMHRRGPDHRPHLVVGFAAPDIAEVSRKSAGTWRAKLRTNACT